MARARIPLQQDAAGRIRWIEASRGELSDTALGQVAKLRSLEWLEIGGGRVTPAGLAQLKACAALKRLYVHDVDLSDHDPTWLSGLVRLEALSLQRTRIPGRALKRVAATGLRVLNLSGTGVGDDDLAEVARMKALEVLAVQDTKVTGAGLARLQGSQRLNVLNLTNCRIADADLRRFTSMPNLRIVHAAGCDISDAAVDRMKDQLPMLSIFR